MTANPTRTLSTERRQRLGLLTEPLGYVDGQNLYEYVGGGPVDAVDPMGLYEFDVHTSVSSQAAEAAGYDRERDKDFLQGLGEGAVYPDIPEGVLALSKLALGPKDSLTYRSHKGDLQYWHAMAVPGKDCRELKDLIVDWIVSQYTLAKDAKDAKSRGMEIGKALHTIHDSYSLSHTTRIPQRLGTQVVPGPIKQFNDYGAQDPVKHASVDKADANDPKRKSAIAMAQVQSTVLLGLLREGAPPEVVRDWLTKRGGPIELTGDCVAGKTDPAYAPGPGPK